MSGIIPGWGFIALGRKRHAVFLLLAFFSSLGLLAWLRIIVAPTGLKLFSILVLIVYIYSILATILLLNKSRKSIERNKTLWVVCYPVIVGLIIALLFILKPVLFGVAIYKIRSYSMAPTLSEGDRVLVDTWRYVHTAPQVGDVVIVELKKSSAHYVKRVAKKPPHFEGADNTMYYLLSDNSQQSLDSRHFGLISKAQIKGRVAYHFFRGPI